jgi:transketolase
MRDQFIKSLTDLAAEDDRIVLLTADLGFGIFDSFVERFPDRFINVGVAEQSMIGVGTGMALEGWKVFAYSIGNFSTLRCLEQIRNDAAYHAANINVVCSGGGFTYGNLGMSHHATEDLSIMRSLPGVVVLAPCDDFETEQSLRSMVATPGVGYLRIEKNVPINTAELGKPFYLGKARCVREGQDVTLIGCGGLVAEAMIAADRLMHHGVSVRVVSMHTLSSIDSAEIYRALDDTSVLVTLEENQISGGLGGAVAEVIAESGRASKFKRIGLNNQYSSIVGDQAFLRRHYGLDAESVCASILELMS